MYRIKRLVRKLFTPVTMMLIPHSSSGRPISMRLPSIGILIIAVACISTAAYTASIFVSADEYGKMKTKLEFYSEQFNELKSTIFALKKSEEEFNTLFSLDSKKAVLENYSPTDSGSIDMEALRRQVEKTVNDVGDIKDYLSRQKDLYMSTPIGWPVDGGHITSGFGWRIHPLTHKKDFHSGVDISARAMSEVRATADGIVRFAGWSGGSGNLVVIDHGFDFTTCYAHNKKILVKAGQIVKRGDLISYEGSTGSSTGPHVHYEVWKAGKAINPIAFIKGDNW